MIRKARPEDAARICELVGHFITQTSYRDLLPYKPTRIAALVEQSLRIGCILVAEEAGALVGFIAGFPLEEPVAGMRIFDELAWWVEPTHRGGSLVGPKLLRTAEHWAKQKNLQLCKMVAPAGTNVGAFYARMGYTEVETSWIKRL